MKTVWVLRKDGSKIIYVAETWREAWEFAHTYTEGKEGLYGTPKPDDPRDFVLYWRERGRPHALTCNEYGVGVAL